MYIGDLRRVAVSATSIRTTEYMTHDTTPYIWGCVIVSVDTVHVVSSDWILGYCHC